jgi:molybdopterin-guanine dinucleotide biosynthesis protein A
LCLALIFLNGDRLEALSYAIVLEFAQRLECAGRAGAATALSAGETWAERLCASVPKRCRAALATAVQNADPSRRSVTPKLDVGGSAAPAEMGRRDTSYFFNINRPIINVTMPAKP